jgi:hypothetical protein
MYADKYSKTANDPASSPPKAGKRGMHLAAMLNFTELYVEASTAKTCQTLLIYFSWWK